jgi:hypothetical protein
MIGSSNSNYQDFYAALIAKRKEEEEEEEKLKANKVSLKGLSQESNPDIPVQEGKVDLSA